MKRKETRYLNIGPATITIRDARGRSLCFQAFDCAVSEIERFEHVLEDGSYTGRVVKHGFARAVTLFDGELAPEDVAMFSEFLKGLARVEEEE